MDQLGAGEDLRFLGIVSILRAKGNDGGDRLFKIGGED